MEIEALRRKIFPRLLIATRTTAEVEDPKRSLTLDRFEQCVDVLRDVVVAGPLPELACAVFVVGERFLGDFGEI